MRRSVHGLKTTAHSRGINGQKIQVASAVQTARLKKQAFNKRAGLGLWPWSDLGTIHERNPITDHQRRSRHKKTHERLLTRKGAT
jgi:hypothetical protein